MLNNKIVQTLILKHSVETLHRNDVVLHIISQRAIKKAVLDLRLLRKVNFSSLY